MLAPIHTVDLPVEVPGVGQVLLKGGGVVVHRLSCLFLLGVDLARLSGSSDS